MNGESYLDGDYYSDKRELQVISELLVHDLVPLFSDFAVQAGRGPVRVRRAAGTRWPYEIYDTRERRPESAILYSQSTSAMILFGLAVVTSRELRGPLTCTSQLPRSVSAAPNKELSTTVDAGIRSLAESINREVAKGGNCTYSGTFGRDDPLTLSWALPLLELDSADG